MLHDRLIISLWYNSQMQILTLIKHGIIIFFKKYDLNWKDNNS